MATPFAEIYNTFLPQIQDYDMLEQCTADATNELGRYLYSALADCQHMVFRVSNIDLRKRNDDAQEFEDDLPSELINLLATGMIFYWWKSKKNNSDNLRNGMNVKDFSQFSPANLTRELTVAYGATHTEWLQARRAYAQRFSDIAGLRRHYGQPRRRTRYEQAY